MIATVATLDSRKLLIKKFIYNLLIFRILFYIRVLLATIKFNFRAAGGRFPKKYTQFQSDAFSENFGDYWENRINNVMSCGDNQHIPRHPDAGKIVDCRLIMHNGVKIAPLSYYSAPMLKMLMLNRGVHEPQEERIFQDILRGIPEAGCMLELGAYWGFYSLWFNK